jgi:DNA-binding MarR family transcriptional regulator
MVSRTDVPPPSTGYLVWHLALKWRVAMDRALAQHGLTSAQYGVLASLHGLSRSGARPSQRELAEFSGLEPMNVSKLVRGLQRAGLLERAPNPADTRAVQLLLTPRGAELVSGAAGTVRELNDRLLEPFGGRQSSQSSAFADDLQALLRHAAQLNSPPDATPSSRRTP